MRLQVPTFCAACKTWKPRGAFNTTKDNTAQPNCRDCGNPRVLKNMVHCKCTTCGETKHRNTCFSRIRNTSDYRTDCKECRAAIPKAEPVPKVSRVKPAKLVEVHVEPVRVVRDSWELLGMEWSGRKVYDPYNMTNRHGGSNASNVY